MPGGLYRRNFAPATPFSAASETTQAGTCGRVGLDVEWQRSFLRRNKASGDYPMLAQESLELLTASRAAV